MQTSDTRRALRVRSNLLTGRWGGLLGDTGAKEWSADVVGVFNARADTAEHTLGSEMHTTFMQKAVSMCLHILLIYKITDLQHECIWSAGELILKAH